MSLPVRYLPEARDELDEAVERYENDRPVAVEAVVVSTQHSPDVKQKTLRDAIIAEVIEKEIPARLRAPKIKYYVNPNPYPQRTGFAGLKYDV